MVLQRGPIVANVSIVVGVGLSEFHRLLHWSERSHAGQSEWAFQCSACRSWRRAFRWRRCRLSNVTVTSELPDNQFVDKMALPIIAAHVFLFSHRWSRITAESNVSQWATNTCLGRRPLSCYFSILRQPRCIRRSLSINSRRSAFVTSRGSSLAYDNVTS